MDSNGTPHGNAHQMMVRLPVRQRALLDRMADDLEVASAAAVIRGLLLAAESTSAAREAIPLLVRHGQKAEAEAADRRAALKDPSRWTKLVGPGTLWPGDPGVAVEVTGLDPSLPVPPLDEVRARLDKALRLERWHWDRPGASLRQHFKSLRQQASNKRGAALREALEADDIECIAIGWSDPAMAGRVLGRRFVPRTRGCALPMSVVIGAGPSNIEARRMAASFGYDRAVRSAAEVADVAGTYATLADRFLEAGPLDLNRVLYDVQHPDEGGIDGPNV